MRCRDSTIRPLRCGAAALAAASGDCIPNEPREDFPRGSHNGNCDERHLLAADPPLQCIPVAVDLGLNGRKELGVLGLEEVLETALRREELLDGLLVGDLLGDAPLAVFDLVERPEAGLDGELRDSDGVLGLGACVPARLRADPGYG